MTSKSNYSHYPKCELIARIEGLERINQLQAAALNKAGIVLDLGAPPAQKPTPPTTKKHKAPAIKPGAFKCKVPDAAFVERTASVVKAQVYEDGSSSPELTRAYVAEFERLNHFVPTEVGV